MPDAEYLPRQRTLPARQHHAMLVSQRTHELAPVHAVRHIHRRNRVRRDRFVREQRQPKPLHAVPRQLAYRRVPLVDAAHAFVQDAFERHIQREHYGYGRRIGRLTDFVVTLVHSHVEVIARHLRLRMRLPSPLAEADERQPRRQHPALLRRRGDHIAAPSVRADGNGADAAYPVDQQQLVELPLDDRGKCLKVVGNTCGCLVVRYQHRLHIRVVIERLPDLVRVRRAAVLEVEADDLRAEQLGNLAEPLAEHAHAHIHHLIARRQRIHYRRLHRSRSR